jgi:hypothetical protein
MRKSNKEKDRNPNPKGVGDLPWIPRCTSDGPLREVDLQDAAGCRFSSPAIAALGSGLGRPRRCSRLGAALGRRCHQIRHLHREQASGSGSLCCHRLPPLDGTLCSKNHNKGTDVQPLGGNALSLG